MHKNGLLRSLFKLSSFFHKKEPKFSDYKYKMLKDDKTGLGVNNTSFSRINEPNVSRQDSEVSNVSNLSSISSSKPGNENESVELYKLLDDTIGHFGWYQALIIISILASKIVFGANSSLAVFVAARPDFRCRTCFDQDPENSNQGESNFYNYTEKQIEENFFKTSTDKCGKVIIDQCQVDQSVMPISESDNFENKNDCCFLTEETLEICEAGNLFPYNSSSNSNQIFGTCQEYVYDDSVYKSTLITEFELYCGKTYLADLSTSAYMAGYMIGYFTAGPISSYFGRRKPVVLAMFGIIASSFYATYAPSIYHYCLSRFLVALFSANFITSGFTFALEFSGSKARSYINFAWGTGFTLGAILCSYPFALLLREWRDLQFAVTLLVIPFAVLLLFVQQESWKWLMSVDRVEEAQELAVKVYLKQCDKDKKSQNDIDRDVASIQRNIKRLVRISEAEDDKDSKKSSTNIIQRFKILFRSAKITRFTLILIFQFFTVNIVYYGLAFNAGALPGSDLVNNAILGLMDVPGYLTLIFMDKKWCGRKNYMVFMLFVSGIACLASTILLETELCDSDSSVNEKIGRILAFLGKMAVSGAFQAVFQYVSELYSTDVRTDVFGIMNFIGKLGGTLSPLMITLQEIYPMLPGIVFGGFSVVSAIFCMCLPETLGQPMVMSVQEMAQLYH